MLAAFIWGSGHPIGKLILEEIHPVQLSMLSAALTFLTLAVILGISREGKTVGRLGPRGLGLGALGGLLIFFIYPILGFSALQRIPASVNSVLVATSTIFATLIAIPTLGERLRPLNYAGVLLAFVGVPFVVFSSGWSSVSFQALNPSGVLLALGGAIVSALYTITGKAAMSSYDALSITVVASLTGSVLQAIVTCCLFGCREITSVSPLVLVMILYWGIFSGVAYVLYYRCLKGLEAARASSFIYFAPLFAVVSSFVILGEPLGVMLVLGMALIFAGVHLTQKRGV
ncbi:MAG: DMT family transporter [Candidatus Bathyarchaeia archaeon]